MSSSKPRKRPVSDQTRERLRASGRRGGQALAGRPNLAARKPGSQGHERRVRAELRAQIAEVLADLQGNGHLPAPGEPIDAGTLKSALRDAAIQVLEQASTTTHKPGQIARAACELELLGNVLFWTQVRDGELADATVADRIRASENLANRGGLPVLTSTEVALAQRSTVKMYQFSGREPGQRVDDDTPPPSSVDAGSLAGEVTVTIPTGSRGEGPAVTPDD